MAQTPKQIVEQLDKFIVGQKNAKKAVAIALRNRYRRIKVKAELRQEITPKNILMIGPTGVGKTEIARRLAKLANAPFIKVEATKFTEVGYVGRDVDSIIRDLVDIAVKLTREEEKHKVWQHAKTLAEERILNVLLPASKADGENSKARELFRQKLQQGELSGQEIEIEMQAGQVGVEIMGPPGMEEMTSQLQSMLHNLSSDKLRKKKLKIEDALKLLREEEAGKLLNEDEVKAIAKERAEQHGIVFIDEIDKVTQRSEGRGGAEVSREGVQRDLLPLVEGSTVSTKYGTVKTDHILFIASGAFHLAKPSDLIPELQGRFPIRVELDALQTSDFVKILTEPDVSLVKQYQALLQTEGVNLEFTSDGISRIAEIAWEINERAENIGARRLHTVLEKLLEDISYGAEELNGQNITLDATYVNKQLNALVKDEDLTKFIL